MHTVITLEDGTERYLEDSSFIIGSSKDVSDFVIEESTVSRRHARVSLSSDGLEVEDLGSDNGVWIVSIDGSQFTPYLLRGTLRCCKCLLLLGAAKIQLSRERLT